MSQTFTEKNMHLHKHQPFIQRNMAFNLTIITWSSLILFRIKCPFQAYFCGPARSQCRWSFIFFLSFVDCQVKAPQSILQTLFSSSFWMSTLAWKVFSKVWHVQNSVTCHRCFVVLVPSSLAAQWSHILSRWGEQSHGLPGGSGVAVEEN